MSKWDKFLEEDTFSQKAQLHRINCCDETACIQSMPATNMEEIVRRIKLARNKTEDKTARPLPHLMVLQLKKQELKKKRLTPKRITGTIKRSIPEIVGAINKIPVDVKNNIVKSEVDERIQLSYIEQVNRDPFFEDVCDVWKQDSIGENEKNSIRKRNSKLKLKKKKNKL